MRVSTIIILPALCADLLYSDSSETASSVPDEQCIFNNFRFRPKKGKKNLQH